MKIIVPMAGRSRLRPHTLTPKPLIPIAGKPIVQRLVEDIAKVAGKNRRNCFYYWRFRRRSRKISYRNCRKN
jgi:NDP-sugar pyrophosphorylase family protein